MYVCSFKTSYILVLTFQIFTNKATSRKWTDDSEVTNCMSCDKNFSVTVRKVKLETPSNLIKSILLEVEYFWRSFRFVLTVVFGF